MLKLMKYELIKQRTSKVIIGAILALLEVAFLAGMLLGKEEIMAIAAGMLTFLASVTFVIVGLEEIITYYHDLRDKSGYMLFMTPYNVYEIMGSKILTGFFLLQQQRLSLELLDSQISPWYVPSTESCRRCLIR